MSGDGFSEELYEEEVENEEEEGRKMVRSKPRRGSSGQKRSMHKRFRKRTIVSSDDFDEDDEFMTDGTEEERKFVKSRHRSSSSRSRKSESKRLRKRSSRGACEDEEEETDDDYCDEEFIPDGIDFVDEEEMELSRSKPQKGSSGRSKTRLKRLGRRTKLSDDYNEDEDDCDDGDEEFRPDGIDYVDDEEELQVSKSKGGKRTTQKKVSVRSRKRKRKSKVSKKPMKKRRSKISRKRAISSDDDEFIVDSRSVQKSKKKPGKRKKTVVHSDSDFVSSGSSDYEYTISEEEREQVREANSFCGNLIKSRRNSSQADGDVSHQQRKTREGKGKEKVEDLHNDVGKQVCGICLTEEREETVRGILNCCSHYFCFSCIIEWSKVESRCPLCKQRFVTISKPARSTIGIDLRNVVIRVPKRDQVYRPSEEEVRGYYDPYANVVCMECQQGGDDNLMLLCDICDSPAHTYCVGLGREVPEGNWYCEGCRPANPGSSNLLVQDPESHQATSTNNLATGGSNSEGYAAATHISSPVADPSFSQGIEIPQSPRYPSGQGFPATSPMSGVGASTLSGRRWVHRHMHNILSSNRISQMTGIANRADAIAHSNLESAFVNFPVQQQSGQTNQNTRIVGNVPSYSTVMEGRRQDSSSCPEQGRTHLYATLNHLRRQVTQDPSTAIASASGMLCAELAGINVASGCEQLHSGGRPGFGFHDSISPGAHNVGNHLHEAKGTKEQLQSMVKSHLKCLSKGTQLGKCNLFGCRPCFVLLKVRKFIL
uniref:PHD and RING finger domain-containing protein 1 n=1 Tax=Nelumbo nucifera TaxID=4432 RepID=A0A822YM91_NELNU|nr:TPA_asm: hypothetical protein HUJ06_012054 [Nelumbo nucifera]